MVKSKDCDPKKIISWVRVGSKVELDLSKTRFVCYRALQFWDGSSIWCGSCGPSKKYPRFISGVLA
jgi:hypothetical protein